MVSEGSVRRRDESARGDTVTLGLIPAPELPERITESLAGELPGLLGKHVDNGVSWNVPVLCDPLTGDGRDAPEILDVCRDRRKREGWDLAVCLTDLPVYRDGQLIVADVSSSRGVAGISLPALGITRLRRRARDATLQLACELYQSNPDLNRDAGASCLPGERPQRLVSRRFTEFVIPIGRVTPPNDDMKDMDVDVRFVSPTARGHLRLLGGMVLANRPWRIFPSFKSTLAAAFATGAYALVTPTIWTLADISGWPRLLLLMVVSITALAVWLIVAHDLWERPVDRRASGKVALYNAATALTLTVAVLLSYATLFVLIFVSAWIFVDGGFFQTTLQHPISLADYAIPAWLTTSSLATVAGALGSGLEDEDTVRDATYGYRQRRRGEPQEASGS